MLGYLNPVALLGGALPVHLDRARAAIESRIARPLGLGVVEAAAGIVDVVNAGMAAALRIVSVERGYDPREFTLVAFGGAGPVHAARLAQELDIPQVIVPAHSRAASRRWAWWRAISGATTRGRSTPARRRRPRRSRPRL